MTLPRLGVVIVTFNSADVILDCLESLLASSGVALDIALIDNHSQDDTVALLQDWAAGRQPYQVAADIPFALQPAPKPLALDGAAGAALPHRLHMVETGVNGGFAAGVNRGLALLAALPGVDRFWVLNPDSLVPAHSAAAFALHPAPAGGFAMIGGRVLFADKPDMIQIDGGTINRRTGITGNLSLWGPHPQTPPPQPGQIDFVTGASLIASRQFYEQAGPMPEEYFLYYEEVDWALRRGPLPLLYCPQGIIYHRVGTAIGSATRTRPASPFALYFKHRARMRFMRRYYPAALPVAYAYSLAKSAQLLLKGFPAEARSLLGASLGLGPSAQIRARLDPEAARLAFGKAKASRA
jgi:GT2 family glycosyltransferase